MSCPDCLKCTCSHSEERPICQLWPSNRPTTDHSIRLSQSSHWVRRHQRQKRVYRASSTMPKSVVRIAAVWLDSFGERPDILKQAPSLSIRLPTTMHSCAATWDCVFLNWAM